MSSPPFSVLTKLQTPPLSRGFRDLSPLMGSTMASSLQSPIYRSSHDGHLHQPLEEPSWAESWADLHSSVISPERKKRLDDLAFHPPGRGVGVGMGAGRPASLNMRPWSAASDREQVFHVALFGAQSPIR